MNALVVNRPAASCALLLPASLDKVLERVRIDRPRWSEMPVVTPEQRAAIPAAIALIEPSLVPATPEQIASSLGTVALALPTGKSMSDREEGGRLELYIKALSDIPADILNDACMEAIKRLKFFPKVAELRELAARELARRKWNKATLEILARLHDERYAPPVKPEDMVKPEALAKLAKRIGSRFPSKRKAA